MSLFRKVVRVAASVAVGVAFVIPTTSAVAEEVKVPGCFGASTAIYCNPTVTFILPADADTYNTTIPVCAGDCYDVPVTLVSANLVANPYVCASWTNRSGSSTTRTCQDLGTPRVERCYYSDEVGYRVYNSSGSQIADLCYERPTTPSYQLRSCSYGQSGYYVYDRNNGQTVLDLCFYIQ